MSKTERGHLSPVHVLFKRVPCIWKAKLRTSPEVNRICIGQPRHQAIDIACNGFIQGPTVVRDQSRHGSSNPFPEISQFPRHGLGEIAVERTMHDLGGDVDRLNRLIEFLHFGNLPAAIRGDHFQRHHSNVFLVLIR